MGSFNVSCCVSHLTISPGDPAVLLPLRKGDYFFKDFGTIFEPPFVAYPPLSGVYDDYGRLSDVQPSAYYSVWPLGTKFVDVALGNLDEVIEGYTYAWVRGEVWDHMIKAMPHSGRPPGAFYQSDLSDNVLVMLGFKEDGKTGLERYARRFVDPRVPELYIASDGTWSHVMSGAQRVENNLLYHPDQLVKFWPQPLQTDQIKQLRSIDLTIDNKFKEFHAEVIRDNETLGFFKKYDQDFAEKAALRVSGDFALRQMEQYFRLDGVLSPVREHLDRVQSEIANLVQFLVNCQICNVLLCPSIAGPQFGELEASLSLATLIKDVAQKDQDAYQSAMAEDEEAQ